MGRVTKKLSAAVLALALAAAFRIPSHAQENNGWVFEEGNWYFYESDGRQARNQWLKSGGNLFWMNEDGTMATEVWISQDKNWFYMGGSGAAVTGWHEIKGKWYYFDKETYIMATDTTIESWYVGSDGAWDPSK